MRPRYIATVNVAFTESGEELHCFNILTSVSFVDITPAQLCLKDFCFARLLVREGLLLVLFGNESVPVVPCLDINSFEQTHEFSTTKYGVYLKWSEDAFTITPRFIKNQLYVIYMWARRMRIRLYKDLRQVLWKYLMDDLHKRIKFGQ